MKILQTSIYPKNNIYLKQNSSKRTLYQATLSKDEFCSVDSEHIRANFVQSFGFSPSDILYKQRILKSMGLNSVETRLLDAIAGPDEVLNVMKLLDVGCIDNPAYRCNFQNISSGKYKANFHIHTQHSDGELSVEDLLNQATKYARDVNIPPYYQAITDHNTVEGCKEALRIIANDPQRFKDFKLVLGCEFSLKKRGHTVGLCLNPFDKIFETHYTASNNKSKTDKTFFSFSDKEFFDYANSNNVIGISAHPIFAFRKDIDKRVPIEDLTKKLQLYFKNFRTSIAKAGFEGYYQAYWGRAHDPIYRELFLKLGKQEGLISVGGNDSHHNSIFGIGKPR